MHSHHDHTEGTPSASSPDAEPDPVTAARALLAENERARMQACSEELQAVLAKYDMRLDVAAPQISIVPA
ncbi:hypothetical protein AB0N92_04290 [Streptomyces sp. NPDC093248]|uniref:hypothetical protein n=1 Tax=Streptomyces sp. NPDC093248 TaxID=3155072 RepID=UPI00341DAB1E